MRKQKCISFPAILLLIVVCSLTSCKPKGSKAMLAENAAVKVYVAPGKYDEFYNFVSGGFSGQLAVYGLP